MILLGIDPSTKCTGLAVFHNKTLVFTDAIVANPKDGVRLRISSMGHGIDNFFGQIVDICGGMPNSVCIEEGMYRGKANEALKRLLGVIEYIMPSYTKIITIHPSSLKLFMGSGGLNKLQMATSALDKLSTKKERAILAKAVNDKQWDITDAICVGLYGIEQ